MHPIPPQFDKIIDILASQVAIPLLHDVIGNFSQFFTASIDGSFDLLKLKSTHGLVLNKLNFFLQFLEKRL